MANRRRKSGNSDGFSFLGLQITAACDKSREIKRRLLFGRKAMTNLDRVFKSTDTTLLTKVHRVQAMVFTGVTYGCESWTIKKAEFWRIVFNLCYWRRLFRVPWTARKLNRPILRKSTLNIWRTDAEAEAPILWPSNENSQLTGKDIESKRRRGWQKMRWLDGITNLMEVNEP